MNDTVSRLLKTLKLTALTDDLKYIIYIFKNFKSKPANSKPAME